MDVKGKIVVLASKEYSQQFLIGLPEGVTQADLKGTRSTDWADPVINARDKGAAGIILVAPPQIQGMWQQVRGFFSRGSMFPEKLRNDGGNANPTISLPVMLVSEKVGDTLGVKAGSGS